MAMVASAMPAAPTQAQIEPVAEGGPETGPVLQPSAVYAAPSAESIAMLPIWDRSRRSAPIDKIQAMLAIKLGFRGYEILDREVVELFMRRHRIRFTGGINGVLAQSFQTEIGAKGVLITSVDLYQEANPPKLALTSRLVTTAAEPRILWMDSAVRTGDESPGLLGLGIINGFDEILDKVTTQLADAFAGLESSQAVSNRQKGRGRVKGSRRFRPRVYFAAPEFPDVRRQAERVAVLPFSNDSSTHYAGEILTDQVIRHLVRLGADIIEPGVVRQVLLETRQIYTEGPSSSDTDILRIDMKADLALFGEVDRYLETGPGTPYPVVDFSFRAVDTRTEQAIWSSISFSKGSDGVFFFDARSIPTAQDLASRMSRALIHVVSK